MFESRQQLPQNSGLLVCYTNTIDAYCIAKTIQCSFSLIFLIWTLIQGYKQLTQIKQTRYNYVVIATIILVLLSNIFFCLWNNIFTLYSLQTFFNNIYFLMIVGYVITQYLQKNIISYEKYRIAYIVVLMINGLLFFLMFIYSLIQGIELECQGIIIIYLLNDLEIWFFCVNTECILLSCILIGILIINQRQQIKKLSLLQQTNLKINISNPLKNLWIWISINIGAQIINLIQSGLYFNSQRNNLCQILQNQIWNQVLMIIFLFLTFYSQFFSTLIYLGYSRRKLLKNFNEEKSSNKEYQAPPQFQISYQHQHEQCKNSFTLSL